MCEDWVLVALPMITDLGSTYAGLRCGIIRLIVTSGGTTEENAANVLKTPLPKIRETIRQMEEEEIIMTMTVDGKRRLFLTNREYWTEKMMADDFLRGECLRIMDMR